MNGQKEEEEVKESDKCNKIATHFNQKLRLFAEKIGIDVYINDTKRSRNICRFCNKRCNNCDLPKIFDSAFYDFFADKYADVRFEVLLRTPLEISYSNEDKCASGEPTIHDCLELFAEAEELDE